MRVLIITYYYPPDRAVGGQRARKVLEALRADGHDVTVLAAGDRSSDSLVERIRPLPTVRDVWAALRNRPDRSLDDSRPADGTDPSTAAPTAPASEPTPFWKRWVFSLIWLPDDRQGFVLPAVRRALRLPGGPPDLIYTTAPPHSVHLVGLILRVLTRVPWVAEFRDPWTANPWKPAHLRSRFSEWLDRKLEWVCIETADLLVPVSSGIADRLTETGTTTPILTIRNGIENVREMATEAVASSAEAPFEIVYAGSFYHARDPFPFLAALKTLVADLSLGPADIHVRLIGSTPRYDGRSIEEYLGRMDLHRYVSLEGWMEPQRCLRLMEAADALLLIALDQPDQVPNKLYDYLGTRRRILAIADESGETARMLREVGGHHVVPVNDPEQIRRALGEMLAEERRTNVGDPAVLRRWTTTAQMADLRAAVEALRS